MALPPDMIQTYSGPNAVKSNQLLPTRQLAPTISWSDMSQLDHFVQFYDIDEFLLDAVSDFIGAGLGSGAACLAIITPAHLEGLTHRLQANGLDLSEARAQGKYFVLDAAETLSQISRDGSLDAQQFTHIVGGVIEQANKGSKPMRIFGEMVTLLWQQSQQAVALHLEALWNDLRSSTHPFSLFCAYPMSLFAGQEHESLFTQTCELHSHVIPHEGYSQIASSDERLRAVSLLQQKALSLKVEVEERRTMQERLRSSENRYRRLLEAANEGILIVDPNSGLITNANPFIIHLLNKTREQIVQQELWQVGLLPDQPTQHAFLQRLQQDRLLRLEKVKIVTKDNSPCYIDWISTLFQANGHEVIQCNICDITDRRCAEEALLHLASIVASSDDAILSKDFNGIITSWNAAAERMYGYHAEEIVGQSVLILFPPENSDEFSQIMQRIRHGERIEHYETTRVRKDGSLVSVSITISPLRESSGTIIGASTIARDISERKALEQQREAFVSLVTHELKNPLTALQGNVQLAQRRLTRLLGQTAQMEDEQQKMVEDVLAMLVRSQQQLRVEQRLINDLLDLSHIQQDQVELRLATFDLVGLVYEIVQDHQTAHPTRLITLELPKQDPIFIYADRDRITQVLSNYLTNALKFAPASQPVQVSKYTSGNAFTKSPKPLPRMDGRQVWAWVSTSVSNSFVANAGRWASTAVQDREPPSGSPCQFMPFD
ncbi:MAG: PAS domain S-box protein [Chloroflexi bacterium]|nr:MAG: PAS domain S-box protein [Chloroflexota bacterium]